MPGKKVLFLIAPNDYRDEELEIPKELVEAAGHTAVVCSLDRKVCKGMLGGQVMPAVRISEVKPFFYSGIVVVGGSGAPVLGENPDVLRVIQEFFSEKKVVAGICLGPTILAKAGVLRGRKATVWGDVHDKSAVNFIKEQGALYIPAPVVREGILVTANGPGAAETFGNKLVEVLG